MIIDKKYERIIYGLHNRLSMNYKQSMKDKEVMDEITEQKLSWRELGMLLIAAEIVFFPAMIIFLFVIILLCNI